jgi:hypothetical protein
VVIHACNPCTREAEAGNHGVHASLGYIGNSRLVWAMIRLCFKKPKQTEKKVHSCTAVPLLNPICYIDGFKVGMWPGMVVHISNPSYSRGGDREGH